MKTTGKTLEELFPGSARVAGPDDPIYQSGVTMTFIRRPKVSMLTGQEMKAIVERLRRDPKYKR